MHKITNKTNSPFDLQANGGKVVLPAFGEVTAEFDDTYLDLLKAARTVDVAAVKGGGKPAEESDELSKLRADYQEVFGKRAYHGWSAEELHAKIDAKLAG